MKAEEVTTSQPRSHLHLDFIAANSTHQTEGGQVVLGKFVDLNSGYVGLADETGSIYYHAHPDMYPMLEEFKDQQSDVAWLINKQVLQPRIDSGLPFEYTLEGVKSAVAEKQALSAIWNKASDTEIIKLLDDPQLTSLPGRMKELQLLRDSGYQFSLDTETNSFIFIKP